MGGRASNIRVFFVATSFGVCCALLHIRSAFGQRSTSRKQLPATQTSVARPCSVIYLLHPPQAGDEKRLELLRVFDQWKCFDHRRPKK